MRTLRSVAVLVAMLAVAAALLATGSGTAGAAAPPSGDWLTFDYNAQRSGVGPADTGITPGNLHSLQRTIVNVPGTVDSAALELHAVTAAARVQDVLIMTSTYGRTFALNAASGRLLWEFTPPGVQQLFGTGQVTTATPVADPDAQYVYAPSPNGYVYKLSVASGRQVWATRVTYDPTREKLDGSLNFANGRLIVVTGGYYGDIPVYQGHIMTIDPQTGRILHLWNTLCSNVRRLENPPNRCPQSDAGIWGRPGSVVEPDGDILIATGNADFNGHTDWGDSVLELSPALRLLHNWTPPDQQQLNSSDTDLGSTEPALLPGSRLAVMGGKSGILNLLNLNRLDGGRGPAGPRTGGSLQQLGAPGPTDVYSQPAVWRSGGRDYVYVADANGTNAYTFTGGRLHLAWQSTQAGTSPVIAGDLLYVYNLSSGVLNVFNPLTGHIDDALQAAPGHWNSPIVVGGRIVLPVGNYHSQSNTGQVYIYHLPGL